MIAVPPASVRRIVFMGTPDLAVPTLRALHGAGYEIPLVVSRPDARRSRGGQVHASPVKSAALSFGLPVTDTVSDVAQVDADLAVVVAYGRIIPTSLLERLAMVNIHFSLLPRWRGAAPVERAILAGDTHTGVCLMAVEPELDTGAVYRCEQTEISDRDTLESLRGRLVEIGTRQLITALGEGLGEPAPQVGEAVYAKKIRKPELRIDWTRPAEEINRIIRIGGAWTTWREKRLKIIEAVIEGPVESVQAGSIQAGFIHGVVVCTGDGSLRLVEVQPEGKGRVLAEAWVNGARPSVDNRLGS